MDEPCVKEIMTSKVFTIDENATLKDAVKTMAEKNISSLVVKCKEDTRFGIVTRKDAIKEFIVKNGINSSHPLGNVMTFPLVVINPAMKIKEVTIMMNMYRIRRIPVVENGKLVGIVSNSDIFRHLVKKLALVKTVSK